MADADFTDTVLDHIRRMVDAVEFGTAHMHSKAAEAKADATARKHARWLARQCGATVDEWFESKLGEIFPAGQRRAMSASEAES